MKVKQFPSNLTSASADRNSRTPSGSPSAEINHGFNQLRNRFQGLGYGCDYMNDYSNI